MLAKLHLVCFTNHNLKSLLFNTILQLAIHTYVAAFMYNTLIPIAHLATSTHCIAKSTH